MKKLPFEYNLIRGAIGKQFVIKHYRYGIVKTKFPDMSKIRASKRQRSCRNLFSAAVVYARMINNDAKQKAVWLKRIKKGSVYNAAIRAYLLNAKRPSIQLPVIQTNTSYTSYVAAYKSLYRTSEGRKDLPMHCSVLKVNHFFAFCETG